MLNKIIESSNIDAVFITDMYNLRYFTGFTGTTGIALATKEGNFFFSDFRYKEQGAKQVEANGFTFVEVGRNSLDKVKELIDKFGIKKLGFEDLNMTFSYYKKIEELFKVELVQLGSILSNQRLIKKDFEIEIENPYDSNKINVLSVGLWSKNKNHKNTIEIARNIKNDNIVFNIVGNYADNFKDYWEEIFKYIPNNVKIWGEQSDLDKFYKNADIFLFNSLDECNPVSIKEAISYNIPLLIRNLPIYNNRYDNISNFLNDDINHNIIQLQHDDLCLQYFFHLSQQLIFLYVVQHAVLY